MVDKTIDNEFPGDTLKKSNARLLTTDPDSGDDSVGVVGEIEVKETFPATTYRVDDSLTTESTNALEIIKKTGQDTGLERLKINSKGGIIQKAANVTTDFSSIFDVVAELMTYSFIGSSYLYLSHSVGFSIFDVTDPVLPEFIQQVNVANQINPAIEVSVANTTCIKRHGSFVYATYLGDSASNVIGTLILSTPGSGYTSPPTVTITGGAGTGAEGIAIISGGEVIQLILTKRGSGYDGFEVLNITGGGGSGATGSPLIMDTSPGVAVYDTTDIAIPPSEVIAITAGEAILGGTPSLQEVHRFVISGNFGYFPDKFNSKITVIDFTDPLAPRVSAVLSNGDGGMDIDEPVAITVYGNYLVWSNTGTIKSICIAALDSLTATPIAPEQISTLVSSGNDLDFVGDIAVQGNHIYCTPGLAGVETTTDQFVIIDIHEVNTPTKISGTTVSGGSGQMHVHGDHVIIAAAPTAGNILTILDTTDQTNPVELFTADTTVEDEASSLFFLGNFLYLGTKNSGEDAKLNVLNLQGHFTQAINAGVVDTSQLQVTKHAHIQTLDVQSMLHIGAGGTHSDGKITAAKPSAVMPETNTISNTVNAEPVEIDMTNDEQIIILDTSQNVDFPIEIVNQIVGHRATIIFQGGAGGSGVPTFDSEFFISDVGQNFVITATKTVIELQALQIGGNGSMLATIQEQF